MVVDIEITLTTTGKMRIAFVFVNKLIAFSEKQEFSTKIKLLLALLDIRYKYLCFWNQLSEEKFVDYRKIKKATPSDD